MHGTIKSQNAIIHQFWMEKKGAFVIIIIIIIIINILI